MTRLGGIEALVDVARCGDAVGKASAAEALAHIAWTGDARSMMGQAGDAAEPRLKPTAVWPVIGGLSDSAGIPYKLP